MAKAKHPLAKLRQSIRQAGKQYRHDSDNSTSLFHPDEGFVYAYDMGIVEEALDNYEAELSQNIATDGTDGLSVEQKLVKEAQHIVATSEDMDVRDFARSVAAYLIINQVPTEKEQKEGKVLHIVNHFNELRNHPEL